MSRKKRKKQKSNKQRTGISGHKMDGKVLLPPFMQGLNMSPSSWKDDRMPEMLWAVLVVTEINRERALDYFRYVLGYAQKNQVEDLSHTNISEMESESTASLVAYMCTYSDEVNKVLRKLLLFKNLPARAIWEKRLPQPKPEEDWNQLGNDVLKVLDHQSQESTDCRWVKLMAMVLADKIKFPTKDHYEKLFEYPNFGDMREVRPFIRASEISFQRDNKTWPNEFWKEAHKETVCFPVHQDETPKENLAVSTQQLDFIRGHLINYFIDTDHLTSVDPKHDAIFGIVLFSLTLLEEQVATNLSRGSLGRIVLRNIAEAYIVLAYLIKTDDANLWKKYRDFGIGQMKLASLKYEESQSQPHFIDAEKMRRYANEDRWEEFTPIDVGSWDKKDLRKMSTDAGCKDIYDNYYIWPSSYTHSSWGAVRESVMTVCGNPLHRLHFIPRQHPEPMLSTLRDAVHLLNLQLDLLQSQFVEFALRILDEKKLAVLDFVLVLNKVTELKESKK